MNPTFRWDSSLFYTLVLQRAGRLQDELAFKVGNELAFKFNNVHKVLKP